MIYDASVRPNKAVDLFMRSLNPCLTITVIRSCLTILSDDLV